jgi:hypothetical protein
VVLATDPLMFLEDLVLADREDPPRTSLTSRRRLVTLGPGDLEGLADDVLGSLRREAAGGEGQLVRKSASLRAPI